MSPHLVFSYKKIMRRTVASQPILTLTNNTARVFDSGMNHRGMDRGRNTTVACFEYLAVKSSFSFNALPACFLLQFIIFIYCYILMLGHQYQYILTLILVILLINIIESVVGSKLQQMLI